MADTEVRELAGKAAAEIRRRGWMQGFYYPRGTTDFLNCPVCVLGAVLAAEYGVPSALPLGGVHSIPLVKELHKRSGTDAVDWNDTEGRTEGEVLALLDGIAAGQ